MQHLISKYITGKTAYMTILLLFACLSLAACKQENKKLIDTTDGNPPVSDTPNNTDLKEEGSVKKVSLLTNNYHVTLPGDENGAGAISQMVGSLSNAQGDPSVSGSFKALTEGPGWYKGSILKVQKGSTFNSETGDVMLVFYSPSNPEVSYKFTFNIDGEEPYNAVLTSDQMTEINVKYAVSVQQND